MLRSCAGALQKRGADHGSAYEAMEDMEGTSNPDTLTHALRRPAAEARRGQRQPG